MLAQIFKGYTSGKIIFGTLQHSILVRVQNCYVQEKYFNNMGAITLYWLN